MLGVEGLGSGVIVLRVHISMIGLQVMGLLWTEARGCLVPRPPLAAVKKAARGGLGMRLG